MRKEKELKKGTAETKQDIKYCNSSSACYSVFGAKEKEGIVNTYKEQRRKGQHDNSIGHVSWLIANEFF